MHTLGTNSYITAEQFLMDVDHLFHANTSIRGVPPGTDNYCGASIESTLANAFGSFQINFMTHMSSVFPLQSSPISCGFSVADASTGADAVIPQFVTPVYPDYSDHDGQWTRYSTSDSDELHGLHQAQLSPALTTESPDFVSDEELVELEKVMERLAPLHKAIFQSVHDVLVEQMRKELDAGKKKMVP